MATESLTPDEQLEVALLLLDADEERRRDGLERLIRAYGPGVKTWLKRRYGSLLTDEDIGHFLRLAACKVMRKADELNSREDGSLGRWFSTIVLNCVRDSLREQENERRLHAVPLIEELAAEMPADELDSADPDDPVLNDLRECLERLGERLRLIAEADQLAGGKADAETLAQKLGIPKQSIYSYRNKYLQALLRCMNSRGHTEETIARRR
jgi:RNA polymerase sigma factor (sigma-70 family)